jgi:hypothetical protein
VARTFPSARVTLAGADEDARDSSVERAGPSEDVLRERRFHYDLVFAAASTLTGLAELLALTQPQAALIRVEELVNGRGDLEQGRLIRAAASAGLA